MIIIKLKLQYEIAVNYWPGAINWFDFNKSPPPPIPSREMKDYLTDTVDYSDRLVILKIQIRLIKT